LISGITIEEKSKYQFLVSDFLIHNWDLALANPGLLPYVPAGQEFASIEDAESKGMKPRICICCGEEISGHGNTLSRNPNLCASCSSLADGMDFSDHSTLFEAESLSPTPALPAPAVEFLRAFQGR
jgi:hypothetical protein